MTHLLYASCLQSNLTGSDGYVVVVVSLLISSVKPTVGDPVSLVSDGLCSHIRNIYAINTA
jgi:hypothetical protein